MEAAHVEDTFQKIVPYSVPTDTIHFHVLDVTESTNLMQTALVSPSITTLAS